MKDMEKVFEQIGKEIAEMKEATIAREVSKTIGELLRENGVVVNVTECRCDDVTETSFHRKYGASITGLDFTEHDKVFKDEIERLKRNLDLQKDKRLEVETERNYLKERISELEIKETGNTDKIPDSITIDGYKCKIIKTESGLYISRDEIYSIIDKEKEPIKKQCKELEDRHQSDCIEINRLNTTIDVLIHKVEYLRQFAGLE